MKTIRSLMILAGLSLVLFALSATGAKAQIMPSANFRGTFTLPVAAQWGEMSLPAGEYTLSYGQPFRGGTYAVAVTSKADGKGRGYVLVNGNSGVSSKKDALVCIREGDALVVRTLEMPTIGKSAHFTLPHGTQLTARNGKHNGYTQLAQAPMLIERIPVALNSK